MSTARGKCCVLNSGAGSWAFEPLANQLSAALGIDVSDGPRRFNYLLHIENPELVRTCRSFISLEAIHLAADKRLLAKTFNKNHVPTPQTVLIKDFSDVKNFLHTNTDRKWCLKYPTSSGAHGHRLVLETDKEPANWPKPFVVQELIELVEPEVYRTYCAGGELFGWVVRRFPNGT